MVPISGFQTMQQWLSITMEYLVPPEFSAPSPKKLKPRVLAKLRPWQRRLFKMFKFKTGDEVVVTAGRDKGKKGRVQKVIDRENKVVVEGINIYKRHKKATKNQKSGIYEVARPISLANVVVVCPKCSRLTRIGFRIEGSKKYRICKKCNGRLEDKGINK